MMSCELSCLDCSNLWGVGGGGGGVVGGGVLGWGGGAGHN